MRTGSIGRRWRGGSGRRLTCQAGAHSAAGAVRPDRSGPASPAAQPVLERPSPATVRWRYDPSAMIERRRLVQGLGVSLIALPAANPLLALASTRRVGFLLVGLTP